MRSAQQESEEKGSNQFEKLRQEHIVFIVDEAHRAVSDEEMKRKLSAAMRSAQQESEEKGSNQFEKLRQEHIVFIVDEAHRAVSDEEMKRIKKILPNSNITQFNLVWINGDAYF